MTSIIVHTPDGPRVVRDCDTDDRLVSGEGDPTPVDDLEAHYRDPAEEADFECRLTAAFGIDIDGRPVRGGAA